MSEVTVRPNSTVTSDGTLTGGASVHAVLADDSDASYVEVLTGDEIRVAFANPTAPANSILKSQKIRMRAISQKYGPVATSRLYAGGPSPIGTDSNRKWSTGLVTATILTVNGDDNSPDDAELKATMTNGSLGNWLRLVAAYLDAVYVAAPVVDVIGPGDLTVSAGAVSWAATLDAEGGPQTFYRVKLFSDAVATGGGFDPDTSSAELDSGILSGAATSYGFDVPPDGDWWAYVQVAQTVNGETYWSAWDGLAFNVLTPQPGTPDIVIAGEEGRVRLDLAASVGTLATTHYEIQRSTDGGLSWAPLRTVLGAGYVPDTDEMATAWDFDGGNGKTVRYRARAGNVGATTRFSPWVESFGIWESANWQFKHPFDPTKSFALSPREGIKAVGGFSHEARETVQMPLGADYPVVTLDTRGTKTGALQLQLDTPELRAALDELLAAAVPIQIQAREQNEDFWPDRWVTIGQHQREPLFDKAWCEITVETLPWTEVEAPVGDLVAWPTE